MSKAKVWVEQAPWQRVGMDGQAHNHGAVTTSLSCHLHIKETPPHIPLQGSLAKWQGAEVLGALLDL